MTTRWLLSFHAIDPTNFSASWEVGIPNKLYRLLQNKGHDKAIGRLHVIGDVLQGGTLQIHEGWSRPDREDCYVYLGRPDRDFKSLTIETPAPKGMAFLVFVMEDGTIDEWTWRRIAEERDGLIIPDGVKGEVIWSQNHS